MDWDMKMAWEMNELDPNADPNLRSIRSNNLDCSVDLKLGGFGDFGLNEKWKDHHQRVPTVTTSPPSTSKRARVPNSSNQIVSCLVEGCTADLSNCREYHKRHKVCEVHSKTPTVTVNGQEQRFCQQCSRFHLLAEFDEAKRSCRKRLDGHNRRRRKPQPDSVNSVNLFANHQGNRFSSYNNLFPNTSTNSCWPMLVKSEEEPLYSHQPHHQFSNSFPQSFKEIKNFPYLQDYHRPESSSELFSSNHAQDSTCALSLLSSPPLTHIMPERLSMPQPLFSFSASSSTNMHVPNTVFSSPGLDGENVNTVEMNCTAIFDDVDESISEGGSHGIPFSWQ